VTLTAPAASPVRLRANTIVPGARILGFGAAQPSDSTTGAQIGARYGRTAEWIEARTGIRSLRRLRADERLIDLAESAANDALVSSNLTGVNIDTVIAATCSVPGGERLMSRDLVERIAPGAAYFDLNAACSGFCYAASTADSLIRAGAAQHVLLVGAEQMSSIIDPDDLGTGIIFGDGAGAAVFGPNTAARPAIGPVAWGSDGDQAELISFGDEPYMQMQGQQVFRWAVDKIHHVALRACTLAGVTPSDIQVFVPHQANLRIGTAMATKLGMGHAVVSNDITVSGNTSAASIPIGLCRLVQSGRVRSGQLALLVGFGAGLTYAAQVIQLP
jgi:3-oxoacyl-[acyl-carrier-protein] synthase III